MTGPDWDALDGSPLTVERREAAKARVIAAARDVVDCDYCQLCRCDRHLLRVAIEALDAVGTADERKP
jgi:hypothetical protein